MRVCGLVLLALALAAVWAPAQGDEASQAKSVAALEKLGGRIDRDEDRPGKPVVAVGLTFSDIKDADLVHLRGLDDLRKLYLGATGITDKGLAYLTSLKHLEVLDLSKTKVTDAG